MTDNKKYRILIVEDEILVSRDLSNSLEELGYDVVDVVTSGVEAIERIRELKPDIVLMDIVLKGRIDGVEATSEISEKFNIPVVFITSHTDTATVDRAKLTEPLGYIVKPFSIPELRSSIEIALYRHDSTLKIKQESECISSVLSSAGSGIIATDNEGIITYFNPMTEKITGLDSETLSGSSVNELFNLNVDNHDTQSDPIKDFLTGEYDAKNYSNVSVEFSSGNIINIDLNLIRLRNTAGNVSGSGLIFTPQGESGVLNRHLSGEDRYPSGLFLFGSADFRRKTGDLLSSSQTLKITGETGDRDLLIKLINDNGAQLLFIDDQERGHTAADIADELRESGIDLNMIVVTNYIEGEALHRCINGGIKGFVNLDNLEKDIVSSVDTVFRGGLWFDRDLLSSLLLRSGAHQVSENPEGLHLTLKESRITELAARGYSNKQIANELYISENTVKSHMKRIYRKLGIKNRTELIIKHG